MKHWLKRTWAEIDLDAAAANFRAVKAAAGDAMICAVVKANAYGHGAVELAREYQALGADWFAVSNVEEALQLRQGGIQRPILVLGFTPAEEIQVDIFCNGICAVYKNTAFQRYRISASSAADALYEMMPESLKHYWWK